MSSARHRGEVVGFVREQETPDEVIRGTSPAGLAQVEGWVLRAVDRLARKNKGTAAYRHILGATGIDAPLLGPLLARLVDAGRLVWADDGGYLPVGGGS